MPRWTLVTGLSVIALALGLALPASATTVFNGGIHTVSDASYDGDPDMDPASGDDIVMTNGAVVTFENPGLTTYEVGGSASNTSPFSLRVATGSQAIVNADVTFTKKVDICAPGSGTCANASLTLNDGSLLEDIEVRADAELYINGGTVNEIKSFDQAIVYFNGGQVNGDIDTGDEFSFFLGGTARLVMAGGTVIDDLDFFENATGLIVGGSIGDAITVKDSSSVEIQGANFTINGQPVSGVVDQTNPIYGDIQNCNEDTMMCPILTGTLQQGQALETQIKIEAGGKLTLTETAVIPEPGTALLLGTGLLGLALRRRR